MTASLADSAIHAGLFGDPETGAFFTDDARIRTMLRVEGALARVQGELGLIPQDAARAIERAAAEIVIDPVALAARTARDGVPVPALLAAFRQAMGAPARAQYLHWGATSQDIMDTALALRLGQAVALWQDRLGRLIAALGDLARRHAELPMAARSYGQAATPTGFGAVVAGWGQPLIRHHARLARARDGIAVVSLGGAAGTLSAMGPRGPAVRAALAQALGLADPGHSWHAQRDGIGAFAAALAGLATSLGKFGEDLILMSQSGIAEITLADSGGSSTMPQKRNPVGPSVLVALARQAGTLAGAIQQAGLHRQQRDGAAWFLEWLTLPQLCISVGRALSLGLELATTIRPDPESMARGLDEETGLIHAEALSFALARLMPRPEAEARIKALCGEALARRVPLGRLVAEAFPGLDLAPAAPLGCAPDEARGFADAALAFARPAPGDAAPGEAARDPGQP